MNLGALKIRLWVTGLVFLGGVAPAGARGFQDTGNPPIQETTDQIMARPAAGAAGSDLRVRLRPVRSQLSQNPQSPSLASSSPAGTGAGTAEAALVSGPRIPQTVSTQFTTGTLGTTGAFPPDTMGCAGPTQFLSALNGLFQVFDKTGTLGSLNQSPDAFFSNVMSPASGTFTSDPKVRYDRLSGRWFITMIDVPGGSPSGTNRIMIAVSDTGTITGATVWSLFYIIQDQAGGGGDSGLFADFPTLGIDANALYIGCNMFSPTKFIDTTGFVIKKGLLLAGGGANISTSSQVFAFRGLTGGNVSGPVSPQGVDNYDPAATKGYFIGADAGGFGTLMIRRVTWSGGNPTISGNLSLTVAATSAPATVPHLGNTQGTNGRLDASDSRLLGAHMRNGRLWTAHCIGVDSTGVASGSADRAGARWYELQNLDTTPSVAQFGTLFDPRTTANPRHYFFPAVMVSGQGHMAIGTSCAGNAEHINGFTSGRLVGDPQGTLQSSGNPTNADSKPYTSSSTAYNPTGENIVRQGLRRWGDYSYTSVDPADDMTLWTIQEFCDATNSYGCRVAKLLAPPPALPSSVSVPTVGVNIASTAMTLTGTSSLGSGFFDPGAGFANRLQVTASGGVTVNSFTYVNPTTITMSLSTVGASVGPVDITVTNPDGQSLKGTGLITVTGAPTCTVSPSGTVTNSSPIVFTMTFSEAVTGLSAGGITVTNGTKAPVAGSGATYTMAVTPGVNGVVTCQVNAGAAQAVVGGLSNGASNTASVTFDTVPPVPPAITSPGTGTVTNNNRPTISGTAEANSTVNVLDGAVNIGATPANGGGAWSLVPVSALLDGLHSLTATATDSAGNVGGPSSAVSVTIDTVPPTVVASGPASPTNASPIVFTLTFNKTVTGLSAAGITVTNGTKQPLTGSGTTYTLPVTPTADGLVTCQVNAGAAHDLAGNPSVASNVGSVTFDSTPPSAPGTPVGAPSPNHTGIFNVTWTAASDGAGSGVSSYTVQRSVNGAAFTQVASALGVTTLAQAGLGAGAYRYKVQAVDLAGNIGPFSSPSLAVVVNTTAPHTTILASPPNPSSSAGATFLFSSNVPDCTFQTKLDAGAWTSNGSVTSIAYTGLSNASHTFQVRAVDSAGNVDPSPPSYTWTVNTTGSLTQAPDTLLTGQPSNPTAQTSATFTFISTEAGGTFDIQLDGGGWSSNGASGTKTYTALSTGSHTFLVRAVDTALNVDPTPATFSWTIVPPPLDQIAPLLNPFANDVALTNWTISSTDALVTWAVDGTPASMPGNAFFSAPSSLNYNNGIDYDTPGLPNSGQATSPAITISGLPGARLKFFCNYETETAGTDHDNRFVQVSNDSFTTFLVNEQLSTNPGSTLAGGCAAMGTWHEHVIPLGGMTGPIKVRFLFDTVDAGLNNFPGWFIDDFEISDLFVSGLNQFTLGSGVPLPVGGTSSSASVSVGGLVSRDAVGSVTLEVEVQPVGTPFTGTLTASATTSGPGSPLSVILALAGNGSYHWQARTVNGGVTSSWMSFGLNAESDADFIVLVQAATVTAAGGGGSHHHCGMSGWEAVLVLGVLLRSRRRRAR